ncbi:restriction endonuclease subunit S [Endozoicomonas atrinae]|uniref:restriction endonuclease subunit S n=1 Tax=Endozoicomonas atrinae TaxID=1333660 RepID=UPI003B00CEB4
MTLNTYQNILNNLPEAWEAKKFSELGQVISGGTPSRDNPAFWHGDIPWLTPGEISNNAVKYLTETEEKISSSGLNGSGANLLPEKSLMITSRATLGARVINTVPMATNQGFKNVVFYDTDDAGFYYYLLELVKPEMLRRASGTTFLEISSKEFSDIDLPVPPKKERLFIEKTFDTLDNNIRQTEAIITKLQQVKRGLLHDLLTRGIDDSGQLRPPQHLAPELYKESSLGWIPKEWTVDKLDNQIRIIDCKHVTPSYIEEGYPVIRPRNVKTSGLDFTDVEYVSYRDYLHLTDIHEPQKGDIVFSRNASFGVPAYVAEDKRFAIGQDVVVMTEKQANTHFVFYSLLGTTISKQIALKSGGSTFGRINLGEIRELLMQVPTVAEQCLIRDILAAKDQKIGIEKLQLQKLKKQKSGLMNDLLTGKVRVTSLL